MMRKVFLLSSAFQLATAQTHRKHTTTQNLNAMELRRFNQCPPSFNFFKPPEGLMPLLTQNVLVYLLIAY